MTYRFTALLLFSVFVVTTHICAQTYTQFKTGPNTWGGAYVAPVWQKTYNFDVPAYQSPSIKSGSSGSSVNYSNDYSGGNLSGYQKKNKWDFSSSSDSDDKKMIYMLETLIEALDKHYAYLDTAIRLFYAGDYNRSYTLINHLHRNAKKTKVDFDYFSPQGIREKYLEATFSYIDIEYCYVYFNDVKLHEYSDALLTYNQFLSSYVTSGNTYDPKQLFPFHGDYYYVFDTLARDKRPHFDDIVLYDRFLADLFMVETLTGLQKMPEASKFMEAIMSFYSPIIANMSPFYAQMAINYFYLNEPKQAEKYLEYYCHIHRSNTARLAIIDELLFNPKKAHNWTEVSAPERFRFIEKNMLFLDSIQRSGQEIPEFYSPRNWHELYMVRADRPEAYMAKVSALMEDDLELVRQGGVIPGAVEYYMIALLEQGNEKELTRVMETIAISAEVRRQKSEVLAEEHLTWLQKVNLQEAIAIYSKDPETFRKQIEELKKDQIDAYWNGYYKAKAQPYGSALDNFVLYKFAEAGGIPWLQKYAQPYIDFLSDYTESEASAFSTRLEKVGLLPKFRKSRSYPNKPIP